MKCMECKLLKFDGKVFRCPAHPWVSDINVYTEHRNCGASRWYPKYAEDRVRASKEQALELECAIADVRDTIHRLDAYQTSRVKRIQTTLADLIVDWQAELDNLHDEVFKWKAEVERLEKGLLPSIYNGEKPNENAKV